MRCPKWTKHFARYCTFADGQLAIANGHDYHQQYLSDAKNPNGYNHGPNGLTCPVGVARVPQSELTTH
jgi:hypothetical protein